MRSKAFTTKARRKHKGPQSENKVIRFFFGNGSQAGKAVLNSFEDITKNPASLYGKSADEVAAILGPGWGRGNYGVTGTGWKFTKGDKIVFYHEGGRHVGPYYGYSSGTTGKVKIVGEGYKPLPGDKAKIIEAPKE